MRFSGAFGTTKEIQREEVEGRLAEANEGLNAGEKVIWGMGEASGGLQDLVAGLEGSREALGEGRRVLVERIEGLRERIAEAERWVAEAERGRDVVAAKAAARVAEAEGDVAEKRAELALANQELAVRAGKIAELSWQLELAKATVKHQADLISMLDMACVLRGEEMRKFGAAEEEALERMIGRELGGLVVVRLRILIS
ncbi:unnamed protein product [Closterium sp. Yama58-4]|nr:unnamed protein product [Closterium sp. Yama58-4]